ncbi:MAG: hypothetical protein IT327_32385 [Anaerolineae bacterium]|nr:hypothetical protein [Anaerolineae bacterium]
MSTIAEEFIQEGFQKGMRIAMRQSIVDLLHLRLGIPEAKFQNRLAQIQKLDDLRLLVHRAATVDDVIQFEQALAAL